LLVLLLEEVEVTDADALELVMVGVESEVADDTLEEDAALGDPIEDVALVYAAMLLEETVPEELVVVEEGGVVESEVVDDTMLRLLTSEEVAAIDVLPDGEIMGVDATLLEEVIWEEEVATLRLVESKTVGVALLEEIVAKEKDSGLGVLPDDELKVDDDIPLDGMDSDVVVVAEVTYVVGSGVTEDILLEVETSRVRALEVLIDESEGLDDTLLD
jgi:hypothetical protein